MRYLIIIAGLGIFFSAIGLIFSFIGYAKNHPTERPDCRIVTGEKSQYFDLENWYPLNEFYPDTAWWVADKLYMTNDCGEIIVDTTQHELFLRLPGGYIECTNFKFSGPTGTDTSRER